MMTRTYLDPIRLAIAETLLEMERSLCLSADIASVRNDDARTAFQAGFEWMDRFVMKSHPQLGRKGAVCPFVQPVHEDKRLYFCSMDCRNIGFETFLEAMMQVPALYGRIAEQVETRRDLLSLCIFPVNLPASAYYKFIDCAHSILKPIYMVAGLMIGEFHPASTATGAHSNAIRPLRADVPFFAIRSIAVHDHLFIDRDPAAAGHRIHEIECYLRWTGASLSPDDAARYKARVEELKSQLICEEGRALATV
ncbi:DUF6875 domain-containing protein [Trinickia sp. NRRL B-1857]|uniref:DUF6875 domain-containing protein n=1 Tax=Trinickia sp. NRRL B-1857 TaxID=3162879 RepID=UPI003D2942F3